MSFDFSDVEYWNARFLTETEPFEWLQDPDAFLPCIQQAMSAVPDYDRNILHIGSGSSTLSLGLRGLVTDPQRVHNVDYSQYAIDLGRKAERKAFPDNSERTMRWTCVNLLDTSSLMTLAKDELFDPQYCLVVDKSAADSIACGPDVKLNSALFRTNSMGALIGSNETSEPSHVAIVHPVMVLALHLAALTAPGARWLCLSYSNERFSFGSIEDEEDQSNAILNLASFWSVDSKKPVDIQGDGKMSPNTATPVHRPQITYWLYTLVRTNERLGLFNLK